MQKVNNKNVVDITIEEYKKLMNKEIEKKLQKAEEQISEGKTVPAEKVFKELEEKYIE